MDSPLLFYKLAIYQERSDLPLFVDPYIFYCVRAPQVGGSSVDVCEYLQFQRPPGRCSFQNGSEICAMKSAENVREAFTSLPASW